MKTAESTSAIPSIERMVIGLICAVQFVNVLEFMMVMPLGPDFAQSLAIPTSRLGVISGCYTAAAALSGVLASMIIERFSRRTALMTTMLGLTVATIACGLAQDLWTLVAARVLAGLFGGPAMSVALAIVADVIPPQRRGRALSVVMGAFSIASIIGVPAGLEMARLAGWRAAFFAVAVLVIGVIAIVWKWLPEMSGHLQHGLLAQGKQEALLSMLRRPAVALASMMTASVMIGPFMLIPNLATYVQFNLGYPRERLGLLYLVAGIFSLITMRFTGPLVDRYGSFRVGSVGTICMVLTLYFSFLEPTHWLSAMGIYVAFMVSMGMRNVPLQTLSSRVPAPHERARFMSIQSSIQHLSTACGAFVGAKLLSERPDQGLDGMVLVAQVVVALTLVQPVMLFLVERMVGKPASGPGVSA